MAGHNVLDYVRTLEGQTFAPLLLEILLKSGRQFFVKNAFSPNAELEMVALRIWDLRAVDVSTLPEKLNAVADPEEWENFREIDPALDQANLWVHSAEIEGFVEWHDRYWPATEAEEGPTRVRGFRRPEE